MNEAAATGPRARGEGFIKAMGEMFHATEKSEQDALPDQVLTIAMGKLQGLGLTAIYYELRHGHDVQQQQATALAEQAAAMRDLAAVLRDADSSGSAE